MNSIEFFSKLNIPPNVVNLNSIVTGYATSFDWLLAKTTLGVDDFSSEFSESHRDLVGCGGEREGDWIQVRGREGGDNEQVTGRVASEGEGQTDYYGFNSRYYNRRVN